MTRLAHERQPIFRLLQTVANNALKTLGLSIALGALLALDARPAQACSCLIPSVASSYNSSTDVVAARVLFGWNLGSERKYLARVAQPYKGCLDDGDLVVLTTAVSSAACGVQLEVGAEYLVNGRGSGSFLGLAERGDRHV